MSFLTSLWSRVVQLIAKVARRSTVDTPTPSTFGDLWYEVPFQVGDHVRCLTIFNSTCGKTGTITSISEENVVPKRVSIWMDDSPAWWDLHRDTHKHHYLPNDGGSLCCASEHDSKQSNRYDKHFTREMEDLLQHLIVVHVKPGWDMTDRALYLYKLTNISHRRIVRTLCRLMEEGVITSPVTTYRGWPNPPEPTRLRGRVREDSKKQ